MENEATKFVREIEDLINKPETYILEPERKKTDIRNSVLWTGEIPQPSETTQIDEPEEIKNPKEPIVDITPPLDNSQTSLNNSVINNPNSVRSAPINVVTNPNVAATNNYYNTHLNPYAFGQARVGGAGQLNRSILSSQFQGKIPNITYNNVNPYNTYNAFNIMGAGRGSNPGMMGLPLLGNINGLSQSQINQINQLNQMSQINQMNLSGMLQMRSPSNNLNVNPSYINQFNVPLNSEQIQTIQPPEPKDDDIKVEKEQ